MTRQGQGRDKAGAVHMQLHDTHTIHATESSKKGCNRTHILHGTYCSARASTGCKCAHASCSLCTCQQLASLCHISHARSLPCTCHAARAHASNLHTCHAACAHGSDLPGCGTCHMPATCQPVPHASNMRARQQQQLQPVHMPAQAASARHTIPDSQLA